MRASEEVGVRYMQAWEEKYFDRQEGREEGVMETKGDSEDASGRIFRRCDYENHGNYKR